MLNTMKWKSIFFTVLAALLMASCSKERETTEPTPPPTPDEAQYDVYVVGTTYDKDWTTKTPYYWKNGERYELTSPHASVSCQGIVVADGSVYISAEGDGSFCGYWKDAVWHANAMPEGAESFWGNPITVSEGSVYTPGSIYISNDVRPGYWKDDVWNSLPLPEKVSIGSAYSIAIEGGSVYVAGSVGYGWTHTGYWKDGVWQELERPTGAEKAFALQIACAEGSVYVSGGHSVGALSRPCYWVNDVLHELQAPEGVNYYSNDGALAVSEGAVYMAGYYSIGDIYKTCYWKDGVFIPLEAPGELGIGIVNISVSDGSVYVSGTYEVEAGLHACYWRDGERTDLPTPEGVNVEITGIAVVKKIETIQTL